MFDDDEWDSDELQDFLKDADHKAVEYYSQRTNESEAPAKRRKVDAHDDSVFFCGDISDTELSTIENIDKNPPLTDTNIASRKNLICSILSKNTSTQNDSQNTNVRLQETNENRDAKDVRSNVPSTRKNLVLGILQNKDNTLTSRDKNETRTIFTKISQTKSNVSNTLDIPKENHRLNKNGCTVQNSVQLETKKEENKQDNSRRRLLLESLKKPAPKEIENITNDKQCKSVFKPDKQVSEKTTLVRRFPGPAGLLPDIMNNSFPSVSHLKSIDENDNNKLKDRSDSDLSDFCSQNTKNLFTEGAWQTMLDDLPTDFLKGYEISRIKQIASANSAVMKIPFLAGILERIDHSHENPPVILKDFTDSIQGIMHRDIPIKYPGLLEPNVVILLHDTGILKMKMSVTSKYHILISPSNLLAIYSAKGKIVQSPIYEAVLKSDSKQEFEKDSSSDIDKSPSRSNNLLQDSILEPRLRTSNNSKEKSVPTVFEDFDCIETFDDIDDNLFVDVQDITDSQNQKNFDTTKSENNLTINTMKQNKLLAALSTGKNQEDKDKSKTLLNTLKQYTCTKKEMKKMPHLETTTSNATQSRKSFNDPQLNRQSNIANINFDDSLLLSDFEDTSKSENPSECKENSEESKKNIETNMKNMKHQQEYRSSIKSKLRQFKSDDTLTQEELQCPESKESTQNVISSKNNKEQSKIKNPFANTSFADDLLGDNENDTDDEILSQLNIDEICSNQRQ